MQWISFKISASPVCLWLNSTFSVLNPHQVLRPTFHLDELKYDSPIFRYAVLSIVPLVSRSQFALPPMNHRNWPKINGLLQVKNEHDWSLHRVLLRVAFLVASSCHTHKFDHRLLLKPNTFLSRVPFARKQCVHAQQTIDATNICHHPEGKIPENVIEIQITFVSVANNYLFNFVS